MNWLLAIPVAIVVCGIATAAILLMDAAAR